MGEKTSPGVYVINLSELPNGTQKPTKLYEDLKPLRRLRAQSARSDTLIKEKQPTILHLS